MAWSAWASARRGIEGSHTPGSWKLGFITVLTSAFSLAWWLAKGALFFTSSGLPGIAGLLEFLLAYCALFCEASRWMGRGTASALGLAYVSVLVLAAFGVDVGFVALVSLRV